MKKCIALLVRTTLLAGVLAGFAQATPIYQIGGGSLAVTGLFGVSSNPVLDIRGAVLLQVSDTGLPQSPLAIYDSTGGTDPGSLILPFGNSTLFAGDANSGVSGVTAVVSFDFSQARSSGLRLTIPGTVTVNPIGATPTGALAALAAGSPVLFGFQNSAFADLGNGVFVLQWQLTDVAVPEPGTWVLLSTGLMLIGIVRRNRHRLG